MILQFPGGGTSLGGAQTFSAQCLSSDAVGHVVYISGDKTGGFYQVTKVDIDDNNKMPALGIIVSKQSSTECTVQTSGRVESFTTGLTPNNYLFISTSSTLTQNRPANPSTGIRWIQIVAQAMSSTDILIRFFTPIRLTSA